MKTFDYYKAPSDEVFNQIKEKSIEIRNTYDNTYGYVDEKVNYIKRVENYKDNVWAIVGMFDLFNQHRLFVLLEGEAEDLMQEYIEHNHSLLEDFYSKL